VRFLTHCLHSLQAPLVDQQVNELDALAVRRNLRVQVALDIAEAARATAAGILRRIVAQQLHESLAVIHALAHELEGLDLCAFLVQRLAGRRHRARQDAADV
jgi:hypothetical protein